MECLIKADIFFYIFLELEIHCQYTFQNLSLVTNWIFFANIVIYFMKKLPNQITNSNEVKS